MILRYGILTTTLLLGPSCGGTLQLDSSRRGGDPVDVDADGGPVSDPVDDQLNADEDGASNSDASAHEDMSLSPTCGDGSVGEGEECDDGNQVSNDGCAADCSAIEPGFNCSPQGQQCLRVGGHIWFARQASQVDLLASRMDANDGITCNKACLSSLGTLSRRPKSIVVNPDDLRVDPNDVNDAAADATFWASVAASGVEYCYFNLENHHPLLASTSPGTPERVEQAIALSTEFAATIRSHGCKVMFDSGVQFKSSNAPGADTAEEEIAQLADAICIQGYEYANNAPVDANADGIPDANPGGAVANYLANRTRLLVANPDLDFIFPAVGGSEAIINGTATVPGSDPPEYLPARPISQIVEHYDALLPAVMVNGDFLQVFIQSDAHYEQFLLAIGR